MSVERITCCVVGCKRTASRQRHPNADEIICAKCWRGIERRTKLMRARIWRRASRVGWTDGLMHLNSLIWQRCKRQANDARAGLA